MHFFLKAIIVITIMQILIFLFLHKKAKLEYLFVIQAIMIGYVYNLIFPAFTISDEMTHFMSGYHISNMIMGIQDERINERSDGFAIYNLHIRDIDEELFQFPSSFDVNRLGIKNYQRHKIFQKSDLMLIHAEAVGTDYQPFPMYVLMGISITISRILNLSPFMLVWLTRMVNLVIYSLIGMLIIKIIPFGKLMLYTILAMPMGLINAASASYHTLLFSITIFFVAYILRIKEVGKISRRDITVILIMLLIIPPIKGCFLFYILLLTLLPKELFSSVQKWKAFLCISIITGICTWFFYNAYIVDIEKLLSNSHGSRIITYMDAGEGIYLIDILQNPLHYLKLLIRTIVLRGFYMDRSMIQMQTDFGSFAYLLIIGLFFYNSFFNEDSYYFQNAIKDKAILLATYFFTYALMSFIAFFQWGSRQWQIIELKGSYTYQFLPLIGFAIKGNIHPDIMRRNQIALTYFILITAHFAGILNLLFVAGAV
ncbi:DUF2142 domain-containing protein [bacterium D16-54]|nr:DUF2142 domain-containing protein [bacterium D16-54]RKJ13430.1 DUF2142 domain-containing protein [bacterium D16-56]